MISCIDFRDDLNYPKTNTYNPILHRDFSKVLKKDNEILFRKFDDVLRKKEPSLEEEYEAIKPVEGRISYYTLEDNLIHQNNIIMAGAAISIAAVCM